MIIYHGTPSPSDIERAKKEAPRFDHREQYSPVSMTDHGERYILDNGAYRAFVRNEVWDADAFLRRLTQLPEKMTYDPDFVILPDVVTDSKATYKRARIWSPYIEYPTAFPVQDGMTTNRVENVADELGCVALFIGGTTQFKRARAPEFIELAHENDWQAHIGRPKDPLWAEGIGADSIDTTAIIRNQQWDRLREWDEQQTLTAAPDANSQA